MNPDVLTILGGALAQAGATPSYNGNFMTALANGIGAFPGMMMQYQKVQGALGDKDLHRKLQQAQLDQINQKAQSHQALGQAIVGSLGGQGGESVAGNLTGQQFANALSQNPSGALSMMAGQAPSAGLGRQSKASTLDPRLLGALAQTNPEMAIKLMADQQANNKPVVMKSGESLINPLTGQPITSLNPDLTAINPGQSLVNPRTGQISGQAPQAPQVLGKDQRLVDPNTGNVSIPQVTSPIDQYKAKLQTILTRPGLDENTRQRAMMSLQQLQDSGIAAPVGGKSSGNSGGGLTIGGQPLSPYDKSFVETQGAGEAKQAVDLNQSIADNMDFVRQQKGLLDQYQKALDSGQVKGGQIGSRVGSAIENLKSQAGQPNNSQLYGAMSQLGAINQLQTAKALMKGTGSITENERAIAKEASISPTDTLEVQQNKLARLRTLNDATEAANAAKSEWENRTALKDSLGNVRVPGSIGRKINGKSFQDYISQIYQSQLGVTDPFEYLKGQ